MEIIAIALLMASGVLAFLYFRSRLELAALKERSESDQKHAADKLQLLQKSEDRLKSEFENLANRIFEEKGRTLNEQNREKLADILQPFKSQLADFRKRVDEVHESDVKESANLMSMIKTLQDTSNKVSADANNLAAAIKGDAKAQGNWGELIVSRIFEASGLVEGREYAAQESFSSETGERFQPDFVVYLPGDKAVIVDSKVALTAYSRFSAATDDATRSIAIKEHLKSVRNHLKGLQEKNYTQLLGNRTLDFVIMCIPLEPAFQAAMEEDKELIYDIARSKVVITGPGTLVITLKLIAQIWRRENENRNAEAIADKAGKMYDQVVLVHEALADAKKKMGGVNDAFEVAMKRLMDGKGNLAVRAEELRLMGAKVSKALPPGSSSGEIAG